jgi:L-iditol 2-dehydrogenase
MSIADTPPKMKAYLLRERHVFEEIEAETPRPSSREVLIQVRAVGVCGSDLHAYEGTHPFRIPPLILGHELSGDVVAAGDDVAGFKPGDRVTVEPQLWCGVCRYCRLGLYNLCQSRVILGTPGWPGGFAQYITADMNVVYKIPAGVPYSEGTLAEPLSVGFHTARRSRIGPNDTVVIFGAGTVGLTTLIAGLRERPARVIVTDILDFNLSLARQLGAAATVNVLREDVRSVLRDRSEGGGADVVVIAGGSSRLVSEALSMVNKRGRVVLLAFFEEEAKLDLFPIIGGELELTGVNALTAEDFKAALSLLESGEVSLAPVITHTLPIGQIREAFKMIAEKKADVLKTVLTWN